eukprot:9503796-Pyramimonas_sp.AAC.3
MHAHKESSKRRSIDVDVHLMSRLATRERCLRGGSPKKSGDALLLISGHALKCQDCRHAEILRGPH